MIKFHTNN